MSARSSRSVLCFLRNRGEILLIRAPDDPLDRWGVASDAVEDDPERTAREAIRSVVDVADFSLVRAGDPFTPDEAGAETRTSIHPFLFESDSRSVSPDVNGEFEWTSPTEIRRREAVPGLWRAYTHIAPTVETVAADAEHGAAWLSVSALSALRDRAGELATGGDTTNEGPWDDLSTLASALGSARPSMAVVENRVDRAMADASDDRTAEALERATFEGIERAFETNAAAAREVAALLSGTVVTLSRSGTVLDALYRVDDVSVVVGESRPAREGVGVAEALAEDHRVTLAVDAALPHLLATHPVECVLVGADTVLPDGSVVNKVGTHGLAIAAAHEGVPTYVVAASDKIALEDASDFEEGPRNAVYDGDAAIDIANPTFDCTPAEFVTVVTEDGPLSSADVGERADDLAALAARAKDTSPDPE